MQAPTRREVHLLARVRFTISPRCVTVCEIAKLHGFPDWFRFHETKWHGARQIGNAVPPPLAHAMGREIISTINHEPVKPRRILALGNTALLRMGMSSAAKYWNISIPMAKRDRKSGNKKRKQFETGSLMVANA